jgi:hypothetical protein
METSDLLRHQIIKNLTAQQTEKVADAAINLWELLASQIISVVGEGGFNSLYARSVFLTQPTFPWLASSSLSPQADHRFAELKTSLEKQTAAQASEANSHARIKNKCHMRSRWLASAPNQPVSALQYRAKPVLPALPALR